MAAANRTAPRPHVPAIESALGAVLRKAIQRLVVDSAAAQVLYSGGLDSSIVAQVARTLVPTKLVAIGVRESPDLRSAASGAERLGLALQVRVLTDEAVQRAAIRWRGQLEGTSPVDRSVLVATALALDAADGPLVLCGQGADELFLGYAHFRGLNAPAATLRQRQDLDRLERVTWPRSQAVATSLGRRLESPFLDREFVELVQGLPIADRLPADEPKALLRRVARVLGIPEELAGRRKRAFQYGSGINRLLSPRR